MSDPAVADAGTRPGFAARSTVAPEHRGIRRVCLLVLLCLLVGDRIEVPPVGADEHEPLGASGFGVGA